MNKEELKKQAAKLHLDTHDEILNAIEKEGDELLAQINALKSIDISGVTPMTRVDETPVSLFREDVPGKAFEKEKLLENAPLDKAGYIVISKVVGND